MYLLQFQALLVCYLDPHFILFFTFLVALAFWANLISHILLCLAKFFELIKMWHNLHSAWMPTFFTPTLLASFVEIFSGNFIEANFFVFRATVTCFFLFFGEIRTGWIWSTGMRLSKAECLTAKWTTRLKFSMVLDILPSPLNRAKLLHSRNK